MISGRVARTRCRFSVGLRAAACLLLAVIAADLAAGAACDSLAFGVASMPTVGGAAPNGANEPCADVCVPDCFCCSRSVVATPVALPPEPQRLDSVEAPVVKRWTEGIRPVVDRPPLARA